MTVMEWSDEIQLFIESQFRLEDDVTTSVLLPATLGFYGNIVCFVFQVTMALYFRTLNVADVARTMKCRSNWQTIPFFTQTAIVSWLGWAVNRYQFDFCTGNLLIDPTSEAFSSLEFDQNTENGLYMYNLWWWFALWYFGSYIGLGYFKMNLMEPEQLRFLRNEKQWEDEDIVKMWRVLAWLFSRRRN